MKLREGEPTSPTNPNYVSFTLLIDDIDLLFCGSLLPVVAQELTRARATRDKNPQDERAWRHATSMSTLYQILEMRLKRLDSEAAT